MFPIRISRGHVAHHNFLSRITQLALIFLCALAPCALAQNGVWCAKPVGLLERNYAYQENASAIKFAESIALAGGKTFLFISKTSTKSQARAAAGAVVPIGKMMDDKLKTPPKMRAEQLEEAMQEPALQPSLNKFIDAFKGHKPDPNWYFYSNSPQFSDYFKKIKRMNLESPEKGALLLMDQDGEKTLLNQAVADAAKYLHVGLVFVEGKFVRVMSPRSESTCFSVAADPDMPSAEAVASALLQLKNNPSLFEKWRDWPAHTFKANGRMFRDEYQLIRDEP